MTPEQDFERRLTDWLSDGPSMAPAEVVDRALEQTSGRRQRRGVQRWFSIPSQLMAQWRSCLLYTSDAADEFCHVEW